MRLSAFFNLLVTIFNRVLFVNPTQPHSSCPPSPSSTPLRARRFWALLPCAGSGTRAASTGPKQYQTIAGQPLVLHTLAAFAAVPRLAGTLVVVAPDDVFFANYVNSSFKPSFLVAPCGGVTRAQSVLNGLSTLIQQGATAQDWVLVHDAARCLVTPAHINTLIAACEHDAVGGLLAHRLADTLKQSQPSPIDQPQRVASTIERSDKWLAQTPQMFRLGLLQTALAQADARVTDEASAIEAMGHAPLLVLGSAQNFKVTYPDDFALAEAVLMHRQTQKDTP